MSNQPPEQQRIEEPADEPMFATDEQITARLRQAENTATDLHYRAGVLSRELAIIRRIMHPEQRDG